MRLSLILAELDAGDRRADFVWLCERWHVDVKAYFCRTLPINCGFDAIGWLGGGKLGN